MDKSTGHTLIEKNNIVFVDSAVFYEGIEPFKWWEAYCYKPYSKRRRYALNMLQLLENLVLHEKLFLWTGYNPQDGHLHAFDPVANTIFEQEGIICPPHTLLQVDQEQYHGRLHLLEKYSIPDRLASFLAISESSNISFCPDIPDKKLIESVYQQRQAKGSLLATAYRELSNLFQKDIELLEKMGREIKVTIPPIVALIIDRASSVEELLEITLEMRHKFKRVRRAFAEYEFKIRSNARSLRNSLRAARDINRIMSELSRSYSETDAVSIFQWCDFLDPTIGFNMDSLLPSAKTATSGTKLVKRILDLIRLRSFLYFFKLKKQVYNIKRYEFLEHKFNHMMRLGDRSGDGI